MAPLRSQFIRSPAIVTYGGGTFFMRPTFSVRMIATWKDVMTSMYGKVDKVRTDQVFKIQFLLWGAYENLPILFPSYLLNPIYGASVFGNADVPLVIQARNNDRLTFPNVQLTGVPALFLGVEDDLFAAVVEFTALIANGANPEDAGAYFTIDTNAYNDGAFSKANYKRVRYTGAYTGVAGMGIVTPQKGFRVGWKAAFDSVPQDGRGTVDMSVKEFEGSVKFIPVEPTMNQIAAQTQLQGTPLGTLASAAAADFIMSGSNGGPVITLKTAHVAESGFAFDLEPLRNGEMTLETIRNFNGGVPTPIATVA